MMLMMTATMVFQREELPVDIQTFHFGLEPGSEGAGWEKRVQAVPPPPSPSAPRLPALPPPCSPPPVLTDSTAALMPLAVTQVSLQGSARFKVQINFLADMGRGGDCQRRNGPAGSESAWHQGLGEEKSTVWRERASALMKCTWLCLPAWSRRRRRRNQGKELEKEQGEEAGEK